MDKDSKRVQKKGLYHKVYTTSSQYFALYIAKKKFLMFSEFMNEYLRFDFDLTCFVEIVAVDLFFESSRFFLATVVVSRSIIRIQS